MARLDGGAWQANFKLPPGLAAGWHEVSMRIKNSAPSNTRRVAIDTPMASSTPIIAGLCDGTTWKPGQLDLSSGVLALWVAGLPENADCHNVRVFLDGNLCNVIFVDDPQSSEARQINVRVPGGLTPGAAAISVRLGDHASLPVPVQLV
jgi:hypothetical protein